MAKSGDENAVCNKDYLIQKINKLHEAILSKGITEEELQNAYKQSITPSRQNNRSNIFNNTIYLYCIGFILSIGIITPLIGASLNYFLGIRCLVPNNYLIWEATRPVSDCNFCRGVVKPIILPNLTKEEFMPYAYSSTPIIIKNAISHWPASKLLNFEYLKNLYKNTPGALEAVCEDCQFLNFKSNFMSLKDVFDMSKERANYEEGEEPWYVGWSNCHPGVLEKLRKLYPKPHFLPEDSEMPNTDFVFLGYEQGAIMHLDYIPRLMWQAQLRGNKSWIVAPTPECDDQCSSFTFYVEPGDAVLVDTRIWYHGTHIRKGQFSLTIQSEYG